MPADTLTVDLPSPLAERVRASAEAHGLTPEEYVRQQLAFDTAIDAESNDLSWDDRRLEEPGENIPLDQAFDDFQAKIAEARAKLK